MCGDLKRHRSMGVTLSILPRNNHLQSGIHSLLLSCASSFSSSSWHDMLSLAILLFWVWLPYTFRSHQVVCHWFRLDSIFHVPSRPMSILLSMMIVDLTRRIQSAARLNLMRVSSMLWWHQLTQTDSSSSREWFRELTQWFSQRWGWSEWLTTEEWRSYFYSCDRDNPHTAILSFYKQLCPHPTLWAACLL